MGPLTLGFEPGSSYRDLTVLGVLGKGTPSPVSESVQRARADISGAHCRTDSPASWLKAAPDSLQRRLDPRKAVSVGETVRLSEQPDRGVHQRDVREGLREVTHQAFRDRVVLLGQQAQVVAQRQQALEQRH